MIPHLGALAAVTAWLTACATVPVTPETPGDRDSASGRTMIIGTYNIHFDEYGRSGRRSWIRRRDGVASIVRTHNPDILLLQEVATWDGMSLLPGRQVVDLLNLLPEYSPTGAGHRDRLESANPILYRTKRFAVEDVGIIYFAEDPDNPYSYSWGSWSPRFCSWARLYDRELRHNIYVFNVHFHPYLRRHKRQAARILVDRVRLIAGDDPFILGGDFNSFPGSRHMRRISEELSVRDALRGSRVGTYHAYVGVSPWPRIDYIFASRHFATASAEVAYHRYRGRYPSDHYPVFATLPPPEGAGEHPKATGEERS